MSIMVNAKLEDGVLPLPPGHNSVNGFIVVEGAARMISFLVDVFGAEENVRVRTPDRDGSLIHAEVRLGTSTLMLADSKVGWPQLPALTQVYVLNAQDTLDKAIALGARVVTAVTPFYNNVKIARFFDPWNNLWWLYEPTGKEGLQAKSNTQWHSDDPSYVYRSLMAAMSELAASLHRA